MTGACSNSPTGFAWNRENHGPSRPARAKRAFCRSQFGRLFQRLTAHPPMRFIVQCRMQSAGRLLRETTLSIYQIAEDLGYRDVFYFIKHFRKEMGKPPSRDRADGW